MTQKKYPVKYINTSLTLAESAYIDALAERLSAVRDRYTSRSEVIRRLVRLAQRIDAEGEGAGDDRDPLMDHLAQL